MELLALMQTVALFEGLTNEQLHRLIDISDEEVFGEDEIIFEQGEIGDSLYFVVEGQVEVRLSMGPDQPERSQVYLGRGQAVGEMALLDQGPRSATIVSCQDGTVLRSINHEAFTELCSVDTAIGYVIMRNIARDLSVKLRHTNLDLGASNQ